MPIGVPRIIYSWGEEIPPQWTDIYNFVFRRRMIFLMQFLDDDLCNQICGLLINIHMEDRETELENKEVGKSGLFKNDTKFNSFNRSASAKFSKVEELLNSEEDLPINDNYTLEQYTLQKITMEWLNWNAQFFDYSNEPYLFYLADILSKDFGKDKANMCYTADSGEMTKLMKMFKKMTGIKINYSHSASEFGNNLEVYSPFRLLANFASGNYSLQNINPLMAQKGILTAFAKQMSMGDFVEKGLSSKNKSQIDYGVPISPQRGLIEDRHKQDQNSVIAKLFNDLSNKQFSKNLQTHEKQVESAEKALGQRRLRRQYIQDRVAKHVKTPWKTSSLEKTLNYLDYNSYKDARRDGLTEREYYRQQLQQALIEEESKKVYVMINSFGGSVGNGTTVHDALQYIRAGSMTIGLGVAASASSLVLAGGTIGERYVTEACHVMIHQPEGGLNGQASDIWIDSQEIMRIRLDIADIYSLATYRPRHKILRDLDRDFYLTAMETVSYGLADEIATNGVMHDIIEMINKAWNYHDVRQQRLLETYISSTEGADDGPSTQT